MLGSYGLGMPHERLIAWQGPDPLRVDVVAVRLDTDRLSAHGTSTSATQVVDYRLLTGPDWVTQDLDVRVRGDGWARGLRLMRSTAGNWSAERSADGSAVGADSAPLPDLSNALDCDLALCPLTNTMPIRRGRLVEAAYGSERSSSDLAMAWVSLPDLGVSVSQQTYAPEGPVEPTGGALVRFGTKGFSTVIEVDADGLVVNYPAIARLLYRSG